MAKKNQNNKEKNKQHNRVVKKIPIQNFDYDTVKNMSNHAMALVARRLQSRKFPKIKYQENGLDIWTYLKQKDNRGIYYGEFNLADLVHLVDYDGNLLLSRNSLFYTEHNLSAKNINLQHLEVQRMVRTDLDLFIKVNRKFKHIAVEVITKYNEEDEREKHEIFTHVMGETYCLNNASDLVTIMSTYVDTNNSRGFSVDHEFIYDTFIDPWDEYTKMHVLVVDRSTDSGRDYKIKTLADFIRMFNKNDNTLFTLSEMMSLARAEGESIIYEPLMSKLTINELLSTAGTLNEERQKDLLNIMTEAKDIILKNEFIEPGVVLNLKTIEGNDVELQLPCGLTILSGKSGAGKSFLIKQLIHHLEHDTIFEYAIFKYGEPDLGAFVDRSILIRLLDSLSRNDIVIIDSLTSEMIARDREPAGPNGISYAFGDVLTFISSLALSLGKLVIVVLNIGAMTRADEDIKDTQMFDWLRGKSAALIMNFRDSSSVKDIIKTYVSRRNTTDRRVEEYIVHDFKTDSDSDSESSESFNAIKTPYSFSKKTENNKVLSDTISNLKLDFNNEHIYMNNDLM